MQYISKSNLNMKTVISEIEKIKFWEDGTGILMAVRQHAGCPYLIDVIKEIEVLIGKKAQGMMINRLKPDCIIPYHTDSGPHLDRYHLPIVTNNRCYYEDDDEILKMEAGYWYGTIR